MIENVVRIFESHMCVPWCTYRYDGNWVISIVVLMLIVHCSF